MTWRISEDQVIGVLEAAGWKFKNQTPRVRIFGKVGCSYKVDVAKRDKFTETQVRLVLGQAKFSREEIQQFIRDAVKS